MVWAAISHDRSPHGQRLSLGVALGTSFIALLLSSPLTAARLINVTVDDSGADSITGEKILYFPPDHWTTGDNCPGCVAQPDPSQTYAGTWHNATYDNNGGGLKSVPQSARFNFTGMRLSPIVGAN